MQKTPVVEARVPKPIRFVLAVLPTMAMVTINCMGVQRPPAISMVEIQKPKPAYVTLKPSTFSLVSPVDDQGKPYPITFTAKILGGESLEWCVTAVNWYFEEMQRTPSHQEVGCMDRIFQTNWSYHTTGLKNVCFEVVSNEAVAGRICTKIRIGVPREEEDSRPSPAAQR